MRDVGCALLLFVLIFGALASGRALDAPHAIVLTVLILGVPASGHGLDVPHAMNSSSPGPFLVQVWFLTFVLKKWAQVDTVDFTCVIS